MPPKRFRDPIHLTRPVLPKLEDYTRILSQIWDDKWLTNDGRQVQLLKARLESYLRTPNISLFCNGTAALLAAIRGLGLSGEVITTPFTFPATVHVLSACGIKPVFRDIREDDFNLDPTATEAAINSSTTAILPVHIFGVPCDLEAFDRLSAKHNLALVYDGAQAFGAEVGGRGIGTYGHATMLSFHATKLYHSAEGGALCCNTPGLLETVNLVKNFGILNETEVPLIGLNFKMNELSAAMGLCVLEIVDRENELRRDVAKIYLERLAEIPGIVLTPAAKSDIIHYFPILIDPGRFGASRDLIYDELRKYNVLARKYFFPLCSDQPGYRTEPAAELPVARRVAESILCLPIYGGLDEDTVHAICDIILNTPRDS